jgi:hypothetical protein
MPNMSQIIDGYMQELEVDYIALPQLATAARRWLGARTTAEARKLSLDIVCRLYERGLRPGDYWGGDFTYWPDIGCRAVLDRIEREWIAAGADPNLAEPICWFAPRSK